MRLSEALAKIECQDEVMEKHVREARRLLSKSIVRVERPDIDLGDNIQDATDMLEESLRTNKLQGGDGPISSQNSDHGKYCTIIVYYDTKPESLISWHARL